MSHSNTWNAYKKGCYFWRSKEYPDTGCFCINVVCIDLVCLSWQNASFSDCLWKHKQGKQCLLNCTRTKGRPGNRKHLWESQETANSILLTHSQAREWWQLLKLHLSIQWTMRQCDLVQVYFHCLLSLAVNGCPQLVHSLGCGWSQGRLWQLRNANLLSCFVLQAEQLLTHLDLQISRFRLPGSRNKKHLYLETQETSSC